MTAMARDTHVRPRGGEQRIPVRSAHEHGGEHRPGRGLTGPFRRKRHSSRPAAAPPDHRGLTSLLAELLPEFLPERALTRAFSSDSTTYNLAGLLGPALAAMLAVPAQPTVEQGWVSPSLR